MATAGAARRPRPTRPAQRGPPAQGGQSGGVASGNPKGGGARQGAGRGSPRPQKPRRKGRRAVAPQEGLPPCRIPCLKGGRPERGVQGGKPGGGKQHCRGRPPRPGGSRLAATVQPREARPLAAGKHLAGTDGVAGRARRSAGGLLGGRCWCGVCRRRRKGAEGRRRGGRRLIRRTERRRAARRERAASSPSVQRSRVAGRRRPEQSRTRARRRKARDTRAAAGVSTGAAGRSRLPTPSTQSGGAPHQRRGWRAPWPFVARRVTAPERNTRPRRSAPGARRWGWTGAAGA